MGRYVLLLVSLIRFVSAIVAGEGRPKQRGVRCVIVGTDSESGSAPIPIVILAALP